MTHGTYAPFAVALERLREVFAGYQQMPSVLCHSLELQEYTRDASRAAIAGGIPLVAAAAEFGRATAESFPADRLTAITIARTMTRWAAAEYHRPPAVERAAS